MKTRLNEKKTLNPKYGYVILVLMCLGIAMPSFAQYQISGFGKEAIADYLGMSMNDRQFSTLNMVCFLPGAFLSLISGLLVDRLGSRRVVLTGVVLACVGVVLRAFLGSYVTILVSMFLLGVCTTFFNSNAPKILGTWFDPARASVLLGVFLGMTNISMSIGTGMTAFFPTVSSAFFTAAIAAVAVTVLSLLLMRDNPAAQEEMNAGERLSIRACLAVCVRSKGVWLTAFCMLCLTTAAVGAVQFLPTALQYRGMEQSTASLCGMCITLGATAGCLLVPALSHLLRRPKRWMILGGAISAVLYAFAWRLTAVPLLVIGLFLTGVLSTGLTPLVCAIPLQLPEIGPRYAGTAGGFVATIQLIGNTLLPTYVITAIAGDNNYNGMFICFGALVLIFCVLCVFLPLGGRRR